MTRALLFAAALFATPALAADPAEVIAAERAFAADGVTYGIKGSFLRHMSDQAVLFTPAPVNAKAFYEKQSAEGEPKLVWWPEFAGVARSGDLGFTTGPYTVNGKAGGFYFTVWSKGADGVWKWLYDGGPAADASEALGPNDTPVALPVAKKGVGSAQKAFAQVQAREAELAKTAATDAKTAYLAAVSRDARVTGSKAVPAVTPQAVVAELDTRAKAVNFVPRGGSASKAGDFAWTWGDADWTATDGKARKGHYVRIWQTRPEGWRLVYDQLLPA
ncbi:MAG: DUF4440 domain-containing protein [Caulobacter sp.]